MSIPNIALFGVIFQLLFWTPIWLLLVSDYIWQAFPFKVAALLNIYSIFAPIIITFALMLWRLEAKEIKR